MAILQLIRHAQTAAVAAQFGEHDDPPCTVEGLQEANSWSDAPILRNVSAVYASPMLRARSTADLIFPRHTVTTDDRLLEHDLGDWRGQEYAAVRQGYPGAVLPNGWLNARYDPPNGETFPVLVERLVSFLNDLYDDYGDKEEVAVVTHNGTIRVIMAITAMISSEEILAKNQPHLIPRQAMVDRLYDPELVMDRLSAEEACCESR